MGFSHDIICIGAAHWDVIGRSSAALHMGDDRPGKIRRSPGGVALNIALALAGHGLRTALMSVVGSDADGAALIAALEARGVDTCHICQVNDATTDCYMAIEDASGLVGAIADTALLDAVGAAILDPLRKGSSYKGWIVLDGNLSEEAINMIADDPAFGAVSLRVAAAAPAKAARLAPLLTSQRATFYLNRIEAEALGNRDFATSAEAARALVASGAARALVTDGAARVSDATALGVVSATPPKLSAARVTGAGDAFMAAHIAAELQGLSRADALDHAVDAASHHVAHVANTSPRTA